jgi:anti-anti-sigma factor
MMKMEGRMNIQVNTVGNVSVVLIDGKVHQENISAFRKKLLDLVEDGKVNIVIDMIASDYISSIGLTTVVDLKKKVNNIGGDLKLSRINKLVRNLLEKTNLINIIKTFNDVDTAVKSFAFCDYSRGLTPFPSPLMERGEEVSRL